MQKKRKINEITPKKNGEKINENIEKKKKTEESPKINSENFNPVNNIINNNNNIINNNNNNIINNNNNNIVNNNINNINNNNNNYNAINSEQIITEENKKKTNIEKNTNNLLFSSFKCFYCSEFVKDNRECPKCNHLFCFECLKKEQKGNTFKCEVCKNEIINGIKALNCNFCIEKMISQLDVDCPFNCGKKLSRKEIEEHKKNYCPETLVDCFYKDNGCNFKNKRILIKEHEQTCDFKYIICNCGKKILFSEKEKHKIEECPLEGKKLKFI
jgi:hypothetical protein